MLGILCQTKNRKMYKALEESQRNCHNYTAVQRQGNKRTCLGFKQLSRCRYSCGECPVLVGTAVK